LSTYNCFFDLYEGGFFVVGLLFTGMSGQLIKNEPQRAQRTQRNKRSERVFALSCTRDFQNINYIMSA
jgi:hypothetical protein